MKADDIRNQTHESTYRFSMYMTFQRKWYLAYSVIRKSESSKRLRWGIDQILIKQKHIHNVTIVEGENNSTNTMKYVCIMSWYIQWKTRFKKTRKIISSAFSLKHMAMQVKLTFLIYLLFILSQAFADNGTCVTITNDG